MRKWIREAPVWFIGLVDLALALFICLCFYAAAYPCDIMESDDLYPTDVPSWWDAWEYHQETLDALNELGSDDGEPDDLEPRTFVPDPRANGGER